MNALKYEIASKISVDRCRTHVPDLEDLKKISQKWSAVLNIPSEFNFPDLLSNVDNCLIVSEELLALLINQPVERYYVETKPPTRGRYFVVKLNEDQNLVDKEHTSFDDFPEENPTITQLVLKHSKNVPPLFKIDNEYYVSKEQRQIFEMDCLNGIKYQPIYSMPLLERRTFTTLMSKLTKQDMLSILKKLKSDTYSRHDNIE